jgi:hypothetical protein
MGETGRSYRRGFPLNAVLTCPPAQASGLPTPPFCCQASRAELLAALHELGAVQMGPYWRAVDMDFMGHLLELVLLTCGSFEGGGGVAWNQGRLPQPPGAGVELP